MANGAKHLPAKSVPLRASIDWADVYRRLEETARRLQDQDDVHVDASDVLKARARVLAQRPVGTGLTPSGTRIFVFNLSGTLYGLPAEFVCELVDLQEPTPLPGTPAYLRGLINLRSRILPAVDLRPFLSLTNSSPEHAGQWLIIDRSGTQFALWSDEAFGLQQTVLEGREKARLVAGSLNPDYIRAITADGIVVLDLDALIRDLTLDQNVDL